MMLKNHSLSQALRKTWIAYETKVHLALERTSRKNIHQLRISTQKVEAVLSLANSLHSTHRSKNIIGLLKNVRKSLGPMRDIQVESLALESLREKNLNGQKKREFPAFFARRKSKAKKKALDCLEKISFGNARKRIEKLVRKLENIERCQDKGKILSRLDSKIKLTSLKFKKLMKNVNSKGIEEIHRFRIAAKKLRFQEECVNSLTGRSNYDLPNLKPVQSVAGKIQNDSVLISMLERFLRNKKQEDYSRALKIKNRIEDNRTKLIKKILVNCEPK